MTLRTLLLSASLLIAVTAPAAAQDGRPAEVRKRNNCRLAAQVLASGHPHPRYDWARAMIVDCEDEGPAYFAAQWTTAAADTSALRELISGSTRIKDARVYASLRRVELMRPVRAR